MNVLPALLSRTSARFICSLGLVGGYFDVVSGAAGWVGFAGWKGLGSEFEEWGGFQLETKNLIKEEEEVNPPPL